MAKQRGMKSDSFDLCRLLTINRIPDLAVHRASVFSQSQDPRGRHWCVSTGTLTRRRPGRAGCGWSSSGAWQERGRCPLRIGSVRAWGGPSSESACPSPWGSHPLPPPRSCPTTRTSRCTPVSSARAGTASGSASYEGSHRSPAQR